MLKNVAVSLLALIVSLEFFSRSYLFVFDRPLYDEPSSYLNAEYQKYIDRRNSFSSNATPHPFFGYVKRTILTDAKSSGFNTRYPVPYPKKSNEFVVALFGGSVAEHIGNDTSYFENALKEKVPGLSTKKIILLNLALGGMKQPQQFNIYSFFSDNFDISINLDGFNEVAFVNTQLPIEYPGWSTVFFFSTPETKLQIERVQQWRHYEDILARQTQNLFLRHSSFNIILWKSLWKHTTSTHASLAKDLYSKDTLALEKSPFLPVSGNIAHIAAANWARFTRLQGLLAQKINKPAYFFLQPNIHLTGTKPLTALEIEYRNSTLMYQDTAHTVVIDGYKEMRRFSKQYVKADSLSIIDLTQVFHNDSRDLYVDGCCHFNNTGNRVIIDHIVNHIAKHAHY